ncbi:alternate-type signal peptide domain-containing protein [Arthrobacter sp. FW305-BF8]|uniref:alternate-type signal peptide domain-containing protein n=1 Tax=Arthrobacter sp. FW305-BF8 TaxID=2879617 RepID=UPI001F266D05|nr:alternate-type signal peptide domain-containing protein [Arthrobacter sp. FW305-BF8]UKA53450.1 alternate-type signal peptide domain-containing protein [Arthrobacter sp. FW305-BF8]
MKNSTLIKGTAAIAVGAALLLGGGGTLANWNASASTTPGTIVAGDLNVENVAAGTWTDRNGVTIANIANYTVVPGDKLTFTQDLKVTLHGNKMAAKIETSGVNNPNNGFTGTNVTVSPVSLKVGTAAVVNPLVASTNTQTVTATVTFEFSANTADRIDVGATYKFNTVGFTLTQVNSANDGLS